MNENYLMLNGKRVDLTDEQIEKLGLKVEKDDCFKRIPNQKYYTIMGDGFLEHTIDSGNKLANAFDTQRHKAANYCTDESLMQQRAYHETLSRLLWRFSMQNEGDKIDWGNNSLKYFIYYCTLKPGFYIHANEACKRQEVYFYSKEIAQRAIDEIILPFMKEHPDFIW